jgi:hypothetical protein
MLSTEEEEDGGREGREASQNGRQREAQSGQAKKQEEDDHTPGGYRFWHVHLYAPLRESGLAELPDL